MEQQSISISMAPGVDVQVSIRLQLRWRPVEAMGGVPGSLGLRPAWRRSKGRARTPELLLCKASPRTSMKTAGYPASSHAADCQSHRAAALGTTLAVTTTRPRSVPFCHGLILTSRLPG
jgi:hypothetical protein